MVAGTSIGAVNACFLAAHAHAPARQGEALVDAWRSLRLEEVFHWSALRLAGLPGVKPMRRDDRETAQAMGLDDRLWSGLLFFTIGLAIPVSARALGALPVFAFLTIPAAAALLVTSRLRPAFAIATALGLAAAGGGYVLSWFWQIPTGPTMVALAAVFAVPGALLRLGRGA